jgi:transcriptional regulator GlxA family with amidase domain
MAYSVGIVLFNGISPDDMSGFVEPFREARALDGLSRFVLHTVARNKEVVTSDGGLQLLPQHIYPDAHIYDVLLVPGGSGAAEAAKNLRLMNWIKRAAKSAKFVAAVNAGIEILAASQLLDAEQAAHQPQATPLLETNAQIADVIVRNVKLVTAVGTSAGRTLGNLIVHELSDNG